MGQGMHGTAAIFRSAFTRAAALFRRLRGPLLAAACALAALAPAAAGEPVLTVGVNVDYPPYEFVNAQGEPAGYDVDLVRAVARVMGLKIRIKAAPFAEVRRDLEARRIDVLAGMLHSQERDRSVDFSTPYLVVHYSIFVRKNGVGIQELKDLKGRSVLVEQGSQMHDLLKSLDFPVGIVTVRSEPEALRVLASGREDAALVPFIEGVNQIHHAGLSNVRPVGSPVLSRDLCFAVVEGNRELLGKLNTGLGILSETGEYRRIHDKWFGALEREQFSVGQVLRVAAWILVPVALLALIALAWSWSLRRQVHQRTLELRRANHAVQEQEAFLRAVVDTLPVALFGKDPRNDFRFTLWNAKSEEIYGLSREQVLGRSDYEVFPQEQADRFRQVDLEVLAKGQPVKAPEEPTTSRSLGRIFLYTVKFPLMDEDGNTTLLLGISEDITERKASEEALRQAQRLESLGILAGGIAHDFNNLLTAIMGNLNLAQLHLGADSEAMPYLENMEKVVFRAADLTRQMLAYSGKGAFVVQPLDLNAAVRDLAELLKVSISKKVGLRYELTPDMLLIEADHGQIQQVLMNLITNASEAIGDREGTITLSTGTCALGEEDILSRFPGQDLHAGAFVTLRVEDTGCGMSGEVLARLFDPFFTTKFSGRGLGLSALRGILRGHRGGILVSSVEGRGSAFELYFPALQLEQAASPEAPALALDEQEPGTGTILLVDDEQEIRQSTAAMLESMGYKVLLASDGLEAVEQFRANQARIRAVLMDLTMPRMDGREAVKAILNIRPDARIILCSGYNQQEALKGEQAGGFPVFLQKPYRLHEVQEALRKVAP